MGKTILIIIAVLALLLISGLAIAHFKGYCGWPEARMAWVAKRLGSKLELDETQQTQLMQFKDQALEILHGIRDGRPATTDAAIALLDNPRLDREQARRLLHDKQTRLASAAEQLVEAFADFSDSLNDTQRGKLQEMIRRHRDSGHCRFACNRPETAIQQ